MASFHLSRRNLLHVLGGSALALPSLEFFAPRRATAGAAGPPKRFAIAYGGVSIGTRGRDNVVPSAEGTNYELKRGLSPLGAGPLPSDPGLGGNGFDVQAHVSVVSQLKIPWNEGNGVPPGGRSVEFHYNTLGPQVSGMRGGSGRTAKPRGPTADQIAAAGLGTTAFPSLSFRVQAAEYVGSNSTGGDDARLSYYEDDAGDLRPIDPIFSPALAYSTLFDSFAGADPAEVFRLTRRRSAVDVAVARTERLAPMLGAADRIRLERHLDELRALESRLNAVAPNCMKPEDPGEDPPIEGAAIEYQGQGGDGVGYSNEDLRGELLFDMIAMAFACDRSRAAAVRISFDQCAMQGAPLGLMVESFHGYGHVFNDAAYAALADAVAWHVKHFARFIARLRDLEEFDGSSVLDHTAAVLLFEGGHGYNPEGGALQSTHSTENMIALVGGHAGGLNATGGRHIIKPNWHPANAVISALSATNAIPDETLGEVEGRIPELFA